MNKAKVISRDMLPSVGGRHRTAMPQELLEAIVATLGTNGAVVIPKVGGAKMESLHRRNLYRWALRNNRRGQVRTQRKDGTLFAWLEVGKK